MERTKGMSVARWNHGLPGDKNCIGCHIVELETFAWEKRCGCGSNIGHILSIR